MHTIYIVYGIVSGFFIGIILGTVATLAIMIFVKRSKSNTTRMCGLVCHCCQGNKQLQVPVYEDVSNKAARGTATGGIELKSNEAYTYSLRKK